jgi:hypothetical protein
MSDVEQKTVTVTLSYYGGDDDPASGVFARRPVEPPFSHELSFGVYLDDDSIGTPESLRDQPLQIQLSGTARALEAFGTYLLAMGALNSEDPDVHEHFDDIPNDGGGPLHVIVRRRG